MVSKGRKEILSCVSRIVIKVGSNVLASSKMALDDSVLKRISEEVSRAMDKGYKIVLVSSGAILAGMSKLGLQERPRLIRQKQAVAAIGQSNLIRAYEKNFERFGKRVAQILLTDGDMVHRERYINARNTMETLFNYGALPIVNENDTVAVEEIKFGDNDTLSGVVSQMVEADLLIIMSDVDGLYTEDPNRNPDAEFISLVEHIDKDIFALAQETSSLVGIGGMTTKIKAAQTVSKSGTATILVNGRTPGVIDRVMDGEDLGTLFLAEGGKLNRRKCWIAFTLKPRGQIVVDEGARDALMVYNKSLLPSGIKEVRGDFDAGASVSVISDDGREIARGLVNYNSQEISRIKGIKSQFIEQILGYCTADEVMHRDNLAIL